MNVYEQFPSAQVVDYQTESLINYLCCNKPISNNFYSNRELSHLADVKNIIKLVNIESYIFLLTFLIIFIVLLYKKQTKLLMEKLKLASLITIIIITLLWFLSVINFDLFFLKFHYIVFDNDYWQLPQNSNLIKMFPAQFFANFANRIALQTLIMAIIIFLTSFFFIQKYASKRH